MVITKMTATCFSIMPDTRTLRTHPTLLIIDDCSEDREVYHEYLSSDSQYSYQFLEASLARDGLDLFRTQHCDAILLDFRLPDMDGLEVLEKLQNAPEGNCPPVIMLTGQGSEELAVRGMKQGIQDYIVKQNLHPELLQLAVRNVIQQSVSRFQTLKTRDRQRIVSTIGLRVRQSLDLGEILYFAVSETQQLLECDHVAVYQAYPDETSSTVETVRNTMQPDGEVARPQALRVCAEVGTRLSVPTIVPPIPANEASDLESAAYMHPAPIMAVREDAGNNDSLQANADIVVPICMLPSSHEAIVPYPWGYFIVHQSAKKTPWSSEEKEIVHELTAQLAIAIQQAERLAQIQAELKKAKQLNQFKSKVITTVSHEYRTPLATILAASSTLERHHDQLSDDKRLRFLNMIQSKARYMTNLVDDMLAIHKLELDPSRFQPSPINVLCFLADIIEDHREKAQGRHEFRFSVSGRISNLWGDAGILRIAIDNLLSNAGKDSSNGSLIDVLITGNTKSITLTIKYNGFGTPSNDRPNMLESSDQSNAQANAQETSSATDLDLLMVKACINLHQGTMLIQHEQEQGTQISITIPDNRIIPRENQKPTVLA